MSDKVDQRNKNNLQVGDRVRLNLTDSPEMTIVKVNKDTEAVTRQAEVSFISFKDPEKVVIESMIVDINALMLIKD